ncbi:MAG TPA: hypothetical protein VET51_00885 [Burkholderiales bacterium]|nr:hypothetical protein [Burkholderiales bacterium]
MNRPEYAFLTPAPIFAAEGETYSPSLTAHSRTLGPVRALGTLGYDARAYSLSHGKPNLEELRQAKAVVFGEGAPPIEGLSGPLLIFDRNQIPDVYEGPELEPRAPRAQPRSRALNWLAARAGLATESWRIRLLWVGEATDLEALESSLKSLQGLGREIPLELRCLSPQADAVADRLREEDPEALRLAVETWSPAAMRHALFDCDLVVLPQTPLTAIHAGRFAIAPRAARRLGEFAWSGDEPAEGIRWALSHPSDVLDRLRRGQQYVNEFHAPAAVGRAWIRLFMKT